MKKSFLFFWILLISILVQSQPINDDWFEVGNTAYNAELRSIAFTSQDTGFAVGTGGAFLKTTDGGNTWTALNIGYDYFFQKIIFTNAATGYICGNQTNNSQGRILKTTDGGTTWQEVFTYSDRFMDVFFLNSSLGFATAHGRVYRTKNGGATWSYAELTNSYDIHSVWFRTADSGFVAATGKVWMTADTGNSWANILPNSWQQVLFTSDSKGYLVKTNSLYKTTDKGLNWVETTNTGISFLKGCSFVNDSTGLTWSDIDEPGIIKKTTNSGATWTTVMNNPAMKVINITVRRTDNTYFACGMGGLIMKSTDGSTWITLHQGNIPNLINRLCFINDSTLFAVGNGGLLFKSTNRATSWTSINSGVNKDLMGICKISNDTLFVLCNDGSLLKSVNAGNTWQTVNTGITSGATKKGDIVFVNSKVGLIAMDQIYRTKNGGLTWTQVYSNLPVYEISAPSQDTIFAATWAKVLMSSDSGNTWNISQNISSIFWGMDFYNTRIGLAAHQNSKVYSTTDAGTNWNYTAISGVQLEDVRYFNDTTAYVVGWHGKLYKTINNGNTWTQVNSGTFRSFYEIYFGPDGTGYILGQDGMILRRLLTPTFFLKFDISDDDGNAVANATLTLNSASYAAGVDSVGGLAATTYQYIISKAGYVSDTATIQLTSDSVIHVILKKFRTVSFNITNIFANPVNGAQVSLGAYNPETSNTDGLAIFDEVVKSSALSLNIATAGYLAFNSTLNIQGDTSFNIVLQADLDAPLALPASNITDLEFTANWQNVAAADSFRLYVSADNFVTFLSGYNGLYVTGTSQIVSGLNAGNSYQYKIKSVNLFGESDFSNVIQLSTTSNINENFKYMITLFPNPTSDDLIIETDEIINEVLVINAQGLEMPVNIVENCNNRLVINLTACANGAYMIGLRTKTTWIMRKTVVQHK